MPSQVVFNMFFNDFEFISEFIPCGEPVCRQRASYCHIRIIPAMQLAQLDLKSAFSRNNLAINLQIPFQSLSCDIFWHLVTNAKPTELRTRHARFSNANFPLHPWQMARWQRPCVMCKCIHYMLWWLETQTSRTLAPSELQAPKVDLASFSAPVPRVKDRKWGKLTKKRKPCETLWNASNPSVFWSKEFWQ